MAKPKRRWIVMPKWREFQHYHKRKDGWRPDWIKVSPNLLHKDEYLSLTAPQRACLHGLWLMYAKSDGKVPESTAAISRTLNLRVTKATLEALNHAGFIQFSSRKPLEPLYKVSSPEENRSRKENNPMPVDVGDNGSGETEALQPGISKGGKLKCPLCDHREPSEHRINAHCQKTHKKTYSQAIRAEFARAFSVVQREESA